MKKGDKVLFRTTYQHGEGVITDVGYSLVIVETTKVYSNFDDTPMVSGYQKTIFYGQILEVVE